jgi:hypothetical protein
MSKYSKGILDAFFSQAVIKLVEESGGWKRGGCDQQRSNKASLTEELAVSLVCGVVELTKLDGIIASYCSFHFALFTLNNKTFSPISLPLASEHVKVSVSAIHRVYIKQ